MIYDVHYFIKKFEAIPEKKWGEGSIFHHCVYWHCGGYPDNSDESSDLAKILGGEVEVYSINDGYTTTGYKQPTPKQRILAALYDIRAMQEPKVKTVYVTVSEVIKDETKKLILN